MRFTRTLLAAALAIAAILPARAADFYAGRTVSIVIGYSVGGGYDLYARLLARFLDRHLPGNPTVLPQSMPGAGSLKAVMYLSAVAPHDGTVFGTFGRSMVLEPLFSGAKFDPRKLSWLGSITQDVSLCVTSAASPIKTWDDLITGHARMGGQAAGSDPDVYAALLKHLFDSNLRLVTGYPGNNELGLAMDRGEIDGFCGLSWSSLASRHPEWMSGAHKINLIVQASSGTATEAHAPQLTSKTTDPRKLAALRMILQTQAIARPFAAPPNLPPERIAALRQAFLQTVADPEFLAEAAKLGLDVSPVPSTAVDAMLADLYAQPPEVIRLAKEASTY